MSTATISTAATITPTQPMAVSFPASGSFEAQSRDLLPDAAEDARTRLAYGRGRDAQFAGDHAGGHAVDDAAPEQLPGARLELAADELQGTPVELAAQVPLFLVRV